MANFILDDIKRTFKSNNDLAKIILANVILFIPSNLTQGIKFSFFEILGIPESFFEFIYQPWTIISYMFLHDGFSHILFNMLLLYSFGKILSDVIGNRAFLTVYFIGGFVGGVAYLIFSTLISIGIIPLPLFSGVVGASGAVLAVIVAIATLMPNKELNLLFLGPVKLKYIALFAIIISTGLNIDANIGGKMVHVGGALYGYFFAVRHKQGKSTGLWFSRIIETIKNIFKRQPKMKVAYKRPKTDEQFNNEKANNQQEIDAVLDKISKSGYDSLTKKEKDFLFNISNKK
ncbi:MAG: rhomboid family intramembrane serine protease [Flavobacteriales bacterium]|nr:rhomboid family intramembrane serine protease [Flavobacteriales bacterium]